MSRRGRFDRHPPSKTTMNMSSAAVKCLIYIASACASAQTSAIGANLATAASNSAADVEDAGRARALLKRAIAHYNNISDPSFADFTSKSKFVDGELKIAHFQKVGDRIIVVGHYVARSTPEEAQAFLASSSSASTIIGSASMGRIPA